MVPRSHAAYSVHLRTEAPKPSFTTTTLHATTFAQKSRTHPIANAVGTQVPVQRTFQFAEYGHQWPDCKPADITADTKAICCDGLVEGADLQLTHWTGNCTPDSIYADLSTEIALRFVQSPIGSSPEWSTAVVLNNHFDTDGVLSIWTLLNPEEAIAHKEVLEAAAAVGDFDEWPSGCTDVIAEQGIKLDAALGMMASEVQGEEEAYKVVLPQIGPLLQGLESRKDLWGPGWAVIQAADQALTSGAVTASVIGSIGLIMHKQGQPPLPGPVISRALGGPYTGIRRVLMAYEEQAADGGIMYRYEYNRVGHAWVKRLVQRPAVPPPVISYILAELGPDWSELEGMTALVRSIKALDMEPELAAALLKTVDPLL